MQEYQIKDDNPLMLSQRAAHELKKRVRQHELAEAAVMIAEAKNKAVETIKAETDKDILPCPLCGGEAKIEIIEENGEPAAQVCCTLCPLWFGKITPVRGYEVILRDGWNRRF